MAELPPPSEPIVPTELERPKFNDYVLIDFNLDDWWSSATHGFKGISYVWPHRVEIKVLVGMQILRKTNFLI